MKTHLSLFLLLCVALATTPQVCGQDEFTAVIERLAQPYIDAKIVDGLSIGVLKNDQQATVHLGRINEAGTAAKDDTVYEIGSISKVFTGVLLADAVSRKALRLDQPARELMPEGSQFPQWKDREVTLLDISTHTSALPRLPDNMPSLTTDNPYSDYTSELAKEFLAKHQLRRSPGSEYEYSNFAVSFLGHLIASQSDKSYDALLKERICRPLSMNDTAVTLSDSMRKRLAPGHGSPGQPAGNWDFADLPGAGGIHSTTSDMLRFANACLSPPDNEIGAALELSWQRHYDGKSASPSMGLGWHFAGDGNTRWHNGQTGGYHAMLLVNRQISVAVVVLSNTATMEIDQLANDLVRMLAGANIQPRDFKPEVEVDPKVMERYVGRYELAPGLVFTVSVKDKALMVGLTGQPTLQVFPRSEKEWFYKVVDATLTFQVNDQGKCNAVELFQNGARMNAKRIE